MGKNLLYETESVRESAPRHHMRNVDEFHSEKVIRYLAHSPGRIKRKLFLEFKNCAEYSIIVIMHKCPPILSEPEQTNFGPA